MSLKSLKIAKSTGKHEPFNIEKIKRSLLKAGAKESLAQQIIEKIKKGPKIKSTGELYKLILKYLHDTDRVVAARYNLKYALMELGPAGYSFEQFAAELFKNMGYQIQVGAKLKGFCVEHEVDFEATKDNERILAECKFHNRRGLKSDVKVALYMKSRFDDIKKRHQEINTQETHKAIIITNTKFTSETVKYAECVNISLIDWSYPYGNSLADIINNLGLHPITTLTSLNKKQKEILINNGLILCKQAPEKIELLKNLRLTEYKTEKILEEIEAVCKGKTK